MDRKKVFELAAAAQGCSLAEIMAAALRADGSLVVVVYPGPKYVYSPEVVAKIALRSDQVDTTAQLVPGLAPAPDAGDTTVVPDLRPGPVDPGTSGAQPKLIETPAAFEQAPKKTRQRKGK